MPTPSGVGQGINGLAATALIVQKPQERARNHVERHDCTGRSFLARSQLRLRHLSLGIRWRRQVLDLHEGAVNDLLQQCRRDGGHLDSVLED